MKYRMTATGGLVLLVGSVLANAHEVDLVTSQQWSTVLQLHYADGRPFAFEAYELYQPTDEQIPAQVGRTNADGQIIFLAGQQAQWRVRAFAADGHGIDQTIRVEANASIPVSAVPATAHTSGLGRLTLVLAGLGVLFGLFGSLQLFIRRKSRSRFAPETSPGE